MVDRMEEVRGWQREAGLAVDEGDEPGVRRRPGADSKANGAADDDSGVVQVRLLLQRYTWSNGPVLPSAASSLDGASGSERSIEDVIAQIDEATARVNQLTADRVRLASEHARNASQRDFETCVRRVSALHLEAKTHLEMVHHENVEYWASYGDEHDGGLGTIRRNIQSHIVGHYRAALARFRAAADGTPQSAIATSLAAAPSSSPAGGGYRGAVEAETRRRVGLALGPSAGEAQVDRVMKGGADQIQSVLRGTSLDALRDEVEGIDARHTSILALERKVHELAQLFGDLALIVDEGQMSIDNIEHHLRKADEHVKRGAKELERGKAEQDKARQAQCAIAALVMAALGAITAPLVFK